MKIGKTKLYCLGDYTLFGKAVKKNKGIFVSQNNDYLFRRWRIVGYEWEQSREFLQSWRCFISWPQSWLHGCSLYNYLLNCTYVFGALFCSYAIFYPTEMSSVNDLWWWYTIVQREDVSWFFAKVFALPLKYVWLLI